MKMKLLGKVVVGFLIIGTLIGLRSLTVAFQERAVRENKPLVLTQKDIPSPKKTQKEQAISSLENPSQALSGKEKALVQESLTVAMAYLQGQTDIKSVEATYDNRLSLTHPVAVKTLAGLFLGGYRYDSTSLTVHKSDSDNVYQFTFDVIKENEKTISISGNYVTGTSQLELVNFYGLPKHT